MTTRISDLPEKTQRAIENALKKETAKEIKNNDTWLTNTNDMRAVLAAMEGSLPNVTITFGLFTLEPKFHDNQHGFWLKPADGRFVPCGFFTPFKVKTLIAQKEMASVK